MIEAADTSCQTDNVIEAPVLLAFSGGLDTSFCVPWLIEELDRPVVTVTVNTGGIDNTAADDLATRSRNLGARDHHLIDARAAFVHEIIKYLIMGNVRRGHMYPLCVGAERGLQARYIAEAARQLGARTVVHGCTDAGNDQVRFEVALRTLAPALEILGPVRDHAWSRTQQIAFLEDRGLPVPAGGGAYSVNRGLWGVTVGGLETLDSVASIPEHIWPLSAGALSDPIESERHVIGFERGVPDTVDGEKLDLVALIERLEGLGMPFGIGRGIHLGDTLMGTKGRVAYEAPAAEILLTAHRELEKLTLTETQQRIKDSLATPYGDLIHQGHQLEPACRDIETLMISSQQRVTGTVTMALHPGHVFVEGVASPNSLMHASKGAYGEAAAEWGPVDALGFSKIQAVSGLLYGRAGRGLTKP